METLSETKIIQKLNSHEMSLFTVSDFKKFFSVRKDNTVYKIIERLTQKGIFKKLIKRKYLFSLLPSNDFLIANFLHSPSYISLESALSFYGIIAQFPYQITSVTFKKTKLIETLKKEFSYSRIKQEMFFGYEKKDDILIATPEKTLLDFLYLASKGLRHFERDDFDLKIINKKIFYSFLKKSRSAQLNKFLANIKFKL